MSRIANSCVKQAVIVIVIVVYGQLCMYVLLYKLETVGHINSVYNKQREKLNAYLLLLSLQLTNTYLNVFKKTKT